MITLLVEENNPLTPNFYENTISSLQFHQLSCPCGHSGCLSVHGYYYRFIKTPSGKVRFRICRVKCACCSHTHAILLSSMIPFSQVSLLNHLAVINNYESGLSQESLMNSNPYIDESCFRFILRRYRLFWRERLHSMHISLVPVSVLVRSCFALFSYHFMQIKNVPNILFLNTT